MPRKKPTSTRQKKDDQKLKRAVKRGDVSPPPPSHRKKPQKRNAPSSTLAESTRKLQSSFVKPSRKFLEDTKALASTVPLSRPIPTEAAILTEISADHDSDPLTCPRRPKWRYDMTKSYIDANEEGVFKQWVNQTDTALEKWRLADEKHQSDDRDEDDEDVLSVERSPSSFERNLEVWRQLWRVTEISQIVLLLIDSRCPLLHFPPSLSGYLSTHKVILVLTKVDIVGPVRAAAWKNYFSTTFPGLRIVQVQAYTSKEEGFYHQGRTRYKSQLPQVFREMLIEAIRSIHAEMLEPPEKVKANPERLSSWKPSVKRDIDWSTATTTPQESDNVVHNHEPKTEDEEPPFLTIGLLGQPNVGKSSLLNALFGQSKVRASKTPGKTKHFQTLFLTPDIRLVDCPGLVMPNYVPMEMQVLSGVLPISRVSAIPACVHYAAQLLPLETIFNLKHPRTDEPPVIDNRTWREGTKRPERTPIFWTAMDILVAFANKKGWVTAKAGRPDFSRAGNAILRALAEGQVPWGFLPPGTQLLDIEEGDEASGLGWGIWIKRDDWNDRVSEDDSDTSEDDTEAVSASEEDRGEEDAEILIPEELSRHEDEDEDDGYKPATTAIRFSALQLDDED